MNPKAQLMSAPGYVKQTHGTVRTKEDRNWKREHEISRYR